MLKPTSAYSQENSQVKLPGSGQIKMYAADESKSVMGADFQKMLILELSSSLMGHMHLPPRQRHSGHHRWPARKFQDRYSRSPRGS
jgi:hypothetical protein